LNEKLFQLPPSPTTLAQNNIELSECTVHTGIGNFICFTFVVNIIQLRFLWKLKCYYCIIRSFLVTRHKHLFFF